MNTIICSTIVGALMIASFYTFVLRRWGYAQNANQNWWSWWHGLISTFVSVMLGVAVGVWMFKSQNQQTDATQKQKFRSLLTTELSNTKRALSLPDEKQMTIKFADTNYSVLVVYIQPLVLEEAARSNLFDPTETENMLTAARNMKMFNLITETLLRTSSLANNTQGDQIAFLVMNQKNARSTIQGDINIITQQLQLQLLPSSILPY